MKCIRTDCLKAIVITGAFVASGAFAGEPVVDWIRYYNGPDDQNDWGREIALSSDGSVTLCGGSLPANFQEDMAIVRYDRFGNELWSATYNGPSNGVDRTTGVAADDLGNAFMIGNRWNNDVLNQDFLVIKYNSDGSEAWIRQFNGPGNLDDVVWDVTADGVGGAYIAGGNFVQSGTPFLAKHFHIAHYDAAGNIAWQVNYDQPVHHGAVAYHIQKAPDGNLVALGWIRTHPSSPNYDMLTMKLTPTGDVLWVKQWSSPVGQVDDVRMVLRIDNAGNIYSITTVETQDIYLGLDAAVVKYDSDGNQVWQSILSLDGSNGFSDLAADDEGNVFLAGGWDTGSEFSDGFAVALDANGQQRWIRFYDDEPSFDFQEALAVMYGPDGLIYVGLDWQYPDEAGYDYTIVVLDSDGNQLEHWRIDTGSASDTFFELDGWRMDPQGNIYIGAFAVGPTGNSDFTTVRIITQPGSLPGDLNGDQIVDLQDRVLMCAALGSATGGQEYIEAADFNTDGVIDHVDQAAFNALLPPCDGDVVTGTTFAPPPDGVTDGADLAYLLGAWGAQPSCADFVASRTFQPPPDGVVDGADLAYLLGAWGSCQ